METTGVAEGAKGVLADPITDIFISKVDSLYVIFSENLSEAEVDSKEAIARRVAPEVAPFTVAVPESEPDIGIVGRDTVGPTAIIVRLPVARQAIS